MTRSKDFKRLVRARMTKTGEAYTAARAQLLKAASRRAPEPPSAATSIDYAALAGMSDTTLREKTGCTWERWVNMLDYHGADTMRHGEIAAFVSRQYKVDGWWSQMVTVGYERIKGMRARGQRLDGSYEASKSRTFAVPAATLFQAWAEARRRKRWLGDAAITLRSSIPPKSIRLGWRDGTIVAVWFTPRGADKTAVAIAHMKLPSRAEAERLKQYWSDRLDALGDWLSRTPRAKVGAGVAKRRAGAAV
ncbi:MAG TPA: hypothetical protein VFV95_10055 [Vicinamibacterales bacterium]|nr:hypothetical protein [Vicinamibacterales bacterium]